jgi:hypothetical protein
MTKAQKTASAWAASSPEQLLDHVRGAVEADDAAVRAGRQLAAAPAAAAPEPRRERPAAPAEPEVVLSVAPAITQPRRPAVPALLFREPEPLGAS